MKKNLLFMLAVLTITFTSCEKIKDAVSRDVDITPKAVEISIPIIGSTTAQSVLGEATLNINIDSLIRANVPEFGSPAVKSVKLKGFNLELLNGDATNNFSVLESISAELSATNQTTQVLVSLPNNPDVDTRNLVLPIVGSGIELKNYILSGNFKYSLKGKARRVTTKELRVRATSIYTFTFGL